MSQKLWYVYMLMCADDTIYTGITNNLEKRLVAHNSGKGAKYTRGRSPVTLVWAQVADSKSDALKREYATKKLPRNKKYSLIMDGYGSQMVNYEY